MDKAVLKYHDIYFNDETEIYTVKTPHNGNYEVSVGRFSICVTDFKNKKKDNSTAYILWLLLGFLGVHRFYVGDFFKGMLLFLTFGGFGVGWLVDCAFLHKRVDEVNEELEIDLLAKAIEDTEKDNKKRALEENTEKAIQENRNKEASGENIDTIRKGGPFVLPGREELSKYFNEQIVDYVRNMEKYERMGIHSIPATILYGKPGCGKTYAVERLAEFLELPCFEINSGSVASPYIHDTGKKISEVFAKAIESAPSVLIIDEMEAYLSTRENSGFGTHHIEEVDEFLRNIPKALEAKVIIFGMTNMIDLIDPAILRKGRFDSVIEVGMPSKQEVLSVLQNGLKKIPVEDNIELEMIAENLLNRPMSDVGYIIRQAARIAVRNDSEVLKQEHLIEAVNGLKPLEPVKPEPVEKEPSVSEDIILQNQKVDNKGLAAGIENLLLALQGCFRFIRDHQSCSLNAKDSGEI